MACHSSINIGNVNVGIGEFGSVVVVCIRVKSVESIGADVSSASLHLIGATGELSLAEKTEGVS